MDVGFGNQPSREVGQRHQAQAKQRAEKSREKLASEARINKASDDAAGLGRMEQARSLLRSLEGAARNTAQGIDLVHSADAALGEGSEILSRMHELAVQSSNGTLTDADRAVLNEEFRSLGQELDDLGRSAEFNGQALLDGSTSSVDIQTGTDGGDTLTIALTELSSSALGIEGEDVATSSSALEALDDLDAAITSVGAVRGDLGADLIALNSRHSLIQESSLQLGASESRLRDVDVARETSKLAQAQLVAEGSAAILSQSLISASTAQKLLSA